MNSLQIFFEELKELRKAEDELRPEYETSHSTIPGSQTIWSEGTDGDNCNPTCSGTES